MRDRTFRGRRHAELLEGELVDDETLSAIQREYQRATNERLRRALALDFEKAVRERPDEGLTPAEALLATTGLGGPPAEVDDETGEVVVDPWETWNKRWGMRFRLYHAIPNGDDFLAVAHRAGFESDDLAEIRTRWPELVAKVYPRGLRKVPGPPGFEHV